MQRLRSTFKRSRTPTGAEMKSQSSLEVPKQVRSASFDEIQLEVKRHDDNRTSKLHDMMIRTNTITTTTNAATAAATVSSSSSSSLSPGRLDTKRITTLRVPHQQNVQQQRSRSFDVYEKTSLLSPSSKSSGSSGSRKSNGPITSPISTCYHCVCVDEYKKLFITKTHNNSDDDPDVYDADHDNDNDDYNYEDDDDDDNDDDDDDDDGDGDEGRYGIEDDDNLKKISLDNGDVEYFREGSPEIRVTLMTFEELSDKTRNDTNNDNDDILKVDFIPQDRPRRLSRQEALTSFPIGFPLISQPTDNTDDDDDDDDYDDDGSKTDYDDEEDDGGDNRSHDNENKECDVDREIDKSKVIVRDIFLKVPEVKRDRAASVDSCFNNSNSGKSEGNDDYCLAVPQQSIRSRSVDIVLPTDQQTRYKALLPSKETNKNRGEREEVRPNTNREPRSTPDWGLDSINGEHLWVPTAASGDFCYANDCAKHGPRLKCAACRVMAHACCTSNLNFDCKPSFRDVGVRQYREQASTHHHWVHRRSEKGKCANCSKAFQSKLSFSSKEIVAVSCSWCKSAYHNKEACFNVEKIGENCELGAHKTIIVPPSWIVKLPRKGSFKSSLRKSPRDKKSGSVSGNSGASSRKKSRDREKDDKDHGNLWVVKPIPSPNIRPVIVFINPKSGGNQGAKLLQKFQWLLNPRQVFDLTQGGPKMALELFQKVPNLRVLACGGDGTVGWVLSILDQIGVSPSPAVGVLPLGTGNDLARALGWGGGYTDEPIGKILSNIGDSDTTLLDRWQVTVEKNPDVNSEDNAGKGKENLPLNVVNNYFSLGVDAHIALEFHEAREAHPEKFNSRLRNKMFYGQMGGKDLVRRKWKDLSGFVTLECDGQDLTSKLRDHRVHAIVFLNIPSYGGGTHPWAATSGWKEPSTEDGLLEVVGLTTYQLPLLQAGGHGTCIAQCSHAKLVTTRTIPMQVDGEACRVLPSIIEIKLLNKATMLTKRRRSNKTPHNIDTKLESLKLPLMKIRMADYELYHSDKDKLKKIAVCWKAEPLELDATMDLESLRNILAKEFATVKDFCFLDSCTAERFFRIDRAQEQLHYVTDVASEAVYILEENVSSQNIETTVKNVVVEPETAQTSPSNERASMLVETSQNVGHARESTMQHVKSVEKSMKVPKLKEKKDSEDGENKNNIQRQGSSKQISIAERSTADSTPTFISPRDRLFSLSADIHNVSSGFLEKPCDGIIRAAKVGDLKNLKELHEHGFSLLSIDASGQTALHHAARHGHKDIIRYLIACAPSTILNIIDNDKGQTALHKAAQHKRRSVCFMLVAGGATLTISDRHGNTPRQLALIAEDRELAAYLASQEQFQLMTEGMQNF